MAGGVPVFISPMDVGFEGNTGRIGMLIQSRTSPPFSLAANGVGPMFHPSITHSCRLWRPLNSIWTRQGLEWPSLQRGHEAGVRVLPDDAAEMQEDQLEKRALQQGAGLKK